MQYPRQGTVRSSSADYLTQVHLARQRPDTKGTRPLWTSIADCKARSPKYGAIHGIRLAVSMFVSRGPACCSAVFGLSLATLGGLGAHGWVLFFLEGCDGGWMCCRDCELSFDISGFDTPGSEAVTELD